MFVATQLTTETPAWFVIALFCCIAVAFTYGAIRFRDRATTMRRDIDRILDRRDGDDL